MTPWIPFFSLLTIAAALWLVMRLTRIHRLVGPPTSSAAAYKRMSDFVPVMPPVPSEIIRAHLAIRSVCYRWRIDVHMYCLYPANMADQPVHPDDGYLVFVAMNATLSGWLNGCDALAFHHLRRDSDGCIMSSQNIDPVTGQLKI